MRNRPVLLLYITFVRCWIIGLSQPVSHLVRCRMVIARALMKTGDLGTAIIERSGGSNFDRELRQKLWRCRSNPDGILDRERRSRSSLDMSKETMGVQVSEEFVANLRLMVNNPTYSDVLFVCNDGERVHASRLFLAGRSDVLKGMLISGTVESSLSEIALPTISSPVLLCVLEFLYTETVSHYSPRSWRMAWEVISASRFFLLPNLDTETRKCMHDCISCKSEDLPAIASLLTEAMEWKALFDETDVSLRELVTILSSKWSTPNFVQNLSEDAFHYLLANSKSNCENDDGLSVEEYFRFRQVIRWWIGQSDFSGKTEDLLNSITSDEQKALATYRKDSLESAKSPQIVQSWSQESRNSVTRLLSNVDFQRIHPLLLATEVEPLEVASSTQMLSAFRYHALRKPNNLLRKSCGWDHGVSYHVNNQGYWISKVGNTIGCAVMMTPISGSYDIYRWMFYFEQLPSPFCELGFTRERSHLEGKKLSEQKSSEQYCVEVLQNTNEGARVHLGSVDGKHRWKKIGPALTSGSAAVFSFNAYDRTCSLQVGTTDCGIVWEKIPPGTYYPAVSLGELGRVRICILGGFMIH